MSQIPSYSSSIYCCTIHNFLERDSTDDMKLYSVVKKKKKERKDKSLRKQSNPWVSEVLKMCLQLTWLWPCKGPWDSWRNGKASSCPEWGTETDSKALLWSVCGCWPCVQKISTLDFFPFQALSPQPLLQIFTAWRQHPKEASPTYTEINCLLDLAIHHKTTSVFVCM